MKDPRKLTEEAVNRAEEIDEQWRKQEQYVKEEYLNRYRVRARYALLFDVATLAIGTLWLLYYGVFTNLVVSGIVLAVMSFGTFTLIKNVSKVLA